MLMLMSESVSACPCFIAASWWMAGLISDGCELSWGARHWPQNNRDVLSSAAPRLLRPRHNLEGGHSLDTGTRHHQEKLNSSSLINDLSVPGGRSMLNVWARSIYSTLKWEKFVVLYWYCIVFLVFLFIYFWERLVIPLLFLLYSLLILPIWVPALSVPVRPVVSDVVFNNSPIFPFEFPNFSLTMFEVRTILPNQIFAAHTSHRSPLIPSLPSCPPAILSSLKLVNKYGWCIAPDVP